MSLDDVRLHSLAREVFGTKRLYVREAGFTSFKEMNFRWTLRGSEVTLKVSDYLRDAPDDVLEEFLEGAMSYVAGGRHVFGKRYMEYMTSDDFILSKRPIYFRRCRRLTRSDVGEYRNLFDSVQRLIERGLLTDQDIDNTLFSWTSEANYTRLGYCSQMFRIVVISKVFDSPDVPEELLDFVVYHECMHLRQGYRPFNRRPHDSAFHQSMRNYPNHDELERRLNEIPKLKRSLIIN